jgi:hypothetical protein
MYQNRYYRRRKYYKNNQPSLFEMLFEILIAFVVWVISYIFKMLYKLFRLLINKLYKTQYKQKISPNVQEEIKPIPETYFNEQEEAKEVYLPYKKKNYLLTRAEYNFDKVLREVVQDKYYIGRQVPLSSLVEVTTTYKPYRSKIDKKTIDFVLFDKAGYTPYLAIELDDASHSRWDRKERDEFVQDVLDKVGIRLERIRSAYSYNQEEILKIVS